MEVLGGELLKGNRKLTDGQFLPLLLLGHLEFIHQPLEIGDLGHRHPGTGEQGGRSLPCRDGGGIPQQRRGKVQTICILNCDVHGKVLSCF